LLVAGAGLIFLLQKYIAMKNLVSFCIIMCIVCFCNEASAKIWRVNNGGAAADYTTINAAITAATAGDTIQVEGSNAPYSFATAKKIIFIGPGYLLTKNPKTQADPNTANVYGTFSPGSDGSVMMGFVFYSTISLQASNLKISRNYGGGNYIDIGDNTGSTYSNDTIEQNYYCSINYTGNAVISNLQVNNNMLYSISLPVSNASGVFYNNIINTVPTMSNFLVENNIIDGDTINIATTNVFKYNILYNGTTTSANGNGNFYVTAFTNIFVDWTDLFNSSTGTDGDAVLKAGSPAIGKGVGGVDLGVFSGGFAYLLSGMPPVPSIYQLTVPNTINTTPMPVTISIASHN